MIRNGLYRAISYEVIGAEGDITAIAITGSMFLDRDAISVHLFYDNGTFLVYAGKSLQRKVDLLKFEMVFSSKAGATEAYEFREIAFGTDGRLILRKNMGVGAHQVFWELERPVEMGSYNSVAKRRSLNKSGLTDEEPNG